ncbi:hypothetical protein HPB47_006729 [Ixodes persulcatus]|uniref:Uncharacterized protein n=1 Tax=Ixodes persulcatus TaxID=34615 RepID=A0AC60PAH8_IXOPE|nr:hypothetical protein HPB47_006729 [Ixodes persulcatus]
MGPSCLDDVDECLARPCGRFSVCVNLYGSFRCLCQPGFQLEAHLCVRVVTCEEGPCLNGGTCVTRADMSDLCYCKIGFAGRLCETEVPSVVQIGRLLGDDGFASAMTPQPSAARCRHKGPGCAVKRSFHRFPMRRLVTQMSSLVPHTGQARSRGREDASKSARAFSAPPDYIVQWELRAG